MKHALTLFFCLLAPLAASAHTYLQVICEPGVAIYLNDELKGTSNWPDSGLSLPTSPGTYKVKAQKDGFVTQTTEISLRKSDVKVWKLEPFTPLEGYVAPPKEQQNQYGSLIVFSRPEQCTVTLITPSQSEHSWPKGAGSWELPKVLAGKYTVKATARGKTLSYDVDISADKGVVLYFDFRAGGASLRKVFPLESNSE